MGLFTGYIAALAIIGVIEGLTEFLPVSSTFHLLLMTRFLRIGSNEFMKLFEVVIQSGAVFAIVVLYLEEFIKDLRQVKRVFVSFLPTALAGFLLYKVIKGVFFENFSLTISVFFFVGLLFLVVEFLVKKKKIKLIRLSSAMSYRHAFLIGVAQSFSVVPGVSRAGSVILAMMGLGYKREDAVKYSFLLSVPTIMAASAYDLYKSRHTLAGNVANVWFLVMGLVISFVVAYGVVRWFLGYVRRHTLEFFGYYRIILAIILLIVSVV